MKKAKHLVLGEGEGLTETGELKKHVLRSDSNIEYEIDSNGISFMLKGMGILTHDEHAKMVFPKGRYKSFNQVEFNPFDNSVQRVFD